MKQNKKKIYDSKIFWMILSLLASTILWAYISSQDTTAISATLKGVQVQFSGENTLREEHGLAISNVDHTAVNIVIRGSRRTVGTLDASKVVAVIDVSNITQAGDMSWSYYLKYPAGTDSGSIAVVSRSPETIGFTVSALSSKTVEVKGSFEGSMADGFSAQEPTFEPKTITITGSEAALKNIDHAWVSFSKDQVDATFTTETGFKLMDKYGNECSSTGLTYSSDTVKATLPVLETKEVPLDVSLVAGGGATAADCEVTVEPATIKIAGDADKLAAISRIIVGTVQLDSVEAAYSQTMPISLDEGLTNVTGVSEAAVTVKVTGLSEKKFTVTDISCANVPDGYSAKTVTKSLSVTVRGTEAALSSVTADMIRAVADLSGYGDVTGTVMPGVKVYIDGQTNVGAVGEYSITVDITKG
jgi:YbbR domain-containing protein